MEPEFYQLWLYNFLREKFGLGYAAAAQEPVFTKFVQDIWNKAMGQRMPPEEYVPEPARATFDPNVMRGAAGFTGNEAIVRPDLAVPGYASIPGWGEGGLAGATKHELGHAIRKNRPAIFAPYDQIERMIADTNVDPVLRDAAQRGLEHGQAVVLRSGEGEPREEFYAEVLRVATSLSALPGYIKPYFRGLLREG